MYQTLANKRLYQCEKRKKFVKRQVMSALQETRKAVCGFHGICRYMWKSQKVVSSEENKNC